MSKIIPIMCTHNRYDLLELTIASYNRANSKPECLYVFDDCSNDVYSKIKKLFEDTDADVYPGNFNLGANQKAPYILEEIFSGNLRRTVFDILEAVVILDSDCLFAPDWWTKLNEQFDALKDNPDFGCLSIYNSSVTNSNSVNGVVEFNHVSALGMVITPEFHKKYVLQCKKDSLPKNAQYIHGWDTFSSAYAFSDGKKNYLSCPSLLQHIGFYDGLHTMNQRSASKSYCFQSDIFEKQLSYFDNPDKKIDNKIKWNENLNVFTNYGGYKSLLASAVVLNRYATLYSGCAVIVRTDMLKFAKKIFSKNVRAITNGYIMQAFSSTDINIESLEHEDFLSHYPTPFAYVEALIRQRVDIESPSPLSLSEYRKSCEDITKGIGSFYWHDKTIDIVNLLGGGLDAFDIIKGTDKSAVIVPEVKSEQPKSQLTDSVKLSHSNRKYIQKFKTEEELIAYIFGFGHVRYYGRSDSYMQIACDIVNIANNITK